MQRKVHDQMCADTDSLVGLVGEMPLRETIMSWATYHLRATSCDEGERLTSPARQIAFLVAVLVGTPEPDAPVKVDEERVQEVQSLLNRIFFAYAEVFFVGLKEESETWNEAAEIAMPAFLHYFNQGSLATVEQVRSFISGQFAPFDDALAKAFGISASDAMTAIQAIEGMLDESEARARDEHKKVTEARDQLLDEVERGDWGLAELRQQAQVSGATESIRRLMSAIDDMLLIRRADLISKVGEIGDRFWRCFVVRRGQFQRPKYITEPLETDARSLFQVAEGEALALTINQLYTAAVVAFERCLLQSCARERFLERRDQLLEDRVENAVRAFFPADAIIARSVSEEEDGTHEHDLVVHWRESAFVFESKASPPREPFRDPEKAATRIARHFRSDAGIQKGFEQAHRISARLGSGETVALFDKAGEPALTLDPSKIADTFSICITAEDFGVLATDLSVLLKKPDDIHYPWVASINDLESILRAWRYRSWTAEKFVEYLRARSLLHGRLATFDELEVAGCMLTHGSLDHLVNADGDRIVLGHDYSNGFDEIEAAMAGGPAPIFEEAAPPFIGDLRQMLRDELAESGGITRRSPSTTKPTRFGTKVGRNQPCPCGSGLKFKKCCGRP